MKVKWVCRYAGNCRETARNIKYSLDLESIADAAEGMAELIPDRAVLVPVPSSHGYSQANVILAGYIAKRVPGSKVVEAVKRFRPVPKSHILRKMGRPGVPLADHIASMAPADPVPSGHPIILIDNVVTTGNTAKAVEHHLGVETTLVAYASVSRAAAPVPMAEGLLVCIAGSLDYPKLDRVDAVVDVLPPGTRVIHGGARGVDTKAGEAAIRRGFPVEVIKPLWEKYGRAAGPIRNVQMMEKADYLVAFWDGKSKGTDSTIKAARRLEKDYDVILP